MELPGFEFMPEKKHGRPQEGNVGSHGSEALFDGGLKEMDVNGNAVQEPPIKRPRPDYTALTSSESTPWVCEQLLPFGGTSAQDMPFLSSEGPPQLYIPTEHHSHRKTQSPMIPSIQSETAPATSMSATEQFLAALPIKHIKKESTNPEVSSELLTNLPPTIKQEDMNKQPTPAPIKEEPMAEDVKSTAQAPTASKDTPGAKSSDLFDHDDDAFSYLDWKDGVASLPGSNLKFKLTEFGTLEIVSTVETEKGECEWSTKTEHHAGKILKAETSATAEIPPAASTAGKLVDGPAKSENILCCEVCGKYGQPGEFSASGRFCSLSCVGAYTGRRNKGREFTRHVTTSDGKVVKKRRKGKKRKGKQASRASDGMEGEFGEPRAVASTNGKATKIDRRVRTKTVVPLEGVGTSLTAASIPYCFTQPFTWTEYLYTTGAKQVPVSVFKQENPDRDVFPIPCPEFRKGMKLEAIDPKHPPFICVCTIVRVKGCRLRLHFDGWSESYDFWTNVNSPFIFPVGWCEKYGQTLHPPRSMMKGGFTWDKYLKKQNARGAPEHVFQPTPPTQHGFKVGMKLEAVDRKNPDLICVATVTNVIGNRFLVHFDEWEDTYDYWCEDTCPYIHPVGWCAENDKRLNPPNDDEVDTFTWDEYLKATGTVAAPPEIFKARPPPGFRKGQKLEAVDKRNPSLLRAATVADTEEYRLRVHFDGWDDIYDDWFDADSLELHPVGWCAKTRHTLEPPLTTAEKINSAACPTPGCKGIGHVKGAKYSTHHSTFGCPYSLQNLNKDSCLVDRLSANSMTEESDWSYASKNKTTDGRSRASRDESNSPAEWICPTPGCDGTGHVTGQWRTHHSVSGCPKNEANYVKTGKYIPRSPAMTAKKSVSVFTTAATRMVDNSTAAAKSGIVSTRSSAKRSTSEDKRPYNFQTYGPSTQEKAVQHVTLSPCSWPRVTPSPVGGLETLEGSALKERQRISKWSVEAVANHIKALGCVDQAKIFTEQKIDGEAFLLLTQNDIVDILKIKLGPALKIVKSIPVLC